LSTIKQLLQNPDVVYSHFNASLRSVDVHLFSMIAVVDSLSHTSSDHTLSSANSVAL
jgi:hypothetical protein